MIGNLLSDQPITSKRTSSMVPPGMGELNYLQSLIASITNQELNTTASPTFVGLTLSGLTASVPIVTDANKALASVTYAAFKASLAIAQADVSGLTTASSPTFAGMTLTGFSGFLKATAGVLGAGALVDADIPDDITLTNITQISNRSHTSLSDIGTLTHAAIDSYLDQSVKTTAAPTFTGINLEKSSYPELLIHNSTATASLAVNTWLGSIMFAGGGQEYAQIVGAVDDTPGSSDYPGRLAFFTCPNGSSTLAERMRITNGGLVSIGGTSPGAKLAVVTSGTDTGITVGEESISTGKQLTIKYDVTNNWAEIQSVHQGTAYRPLVLQRYGSRVGIGITTPGAQLSIETTASASVIRMVELVNSNRTDTWASGTSINFTTVTNSEDYSSRIVGFTNWYSYGSRLQIQTHSPTSGAWNVGLFIDEYGKVGIGIATPGYHMQFPAYNSNIALGSYCFFSGMYGGADTIMSNNAYADTGGRLLKFSNSSWPAGWVRIYQSYMYFGGKAAGTAGDTVCTPGGTTNENIYFNLINGYIYCGVVYSNYVDAAYDLIARVNLWSHDGGVHSLSDERLKDIIGPFDRGLDDLLKINPIKFKFKKGNSMGLEDKDASVGYSAQGLRQIIPEMVGLADDNLYKKEYSGTRDYLTVDHSYFTPLLINAIKNLSDRIQVLEKKQ